MARHASEHVLEPHRRPMLRQYCQQRTHPEEPCDSQCHQRVLIHDLQVIQQEFFEALPTTSYGRFRWNAHLLHLPRLLVDRVILLPLSRVVFRDTLSRGPSQMFPPCRSRPAGRNGTVRTSERVPRPPPGPASVFHCEYRVHRSSIFILEHRVRSACPPRPRPSPSLRRPRPDRPPAVCYLDISEHEPSTGGLCSPN
jgi:hypothetical protein